MSARWTMRAAAVVVAVGPGCASPSDDDDGWVDTDVAPTSDEGPATDDDGEDGSSGGSGGAEVYGVWLFQGTVVPGTSFTGSGEFAAYDDTDTDHCILVWEFASATPTECSECDFAFELTLGAVDVELELADGECDDWAELAVEGQVIALGYAAGSVYQRNADNWSAVGEGEFTASSGEFYGEIEAD